MNTPCTNLPLVYYRQSGGQLEQVAVVKGELHVTPLSTTQGLNIIAMLSDLVARTHHKNERKPSS